QRFCEASLTIRYTRLRTALNERCTRWLAPVPNAIIRWASRGKDSRGATHAWSRLSNRGGPARVVAGRIARAVVAPGGRAPGNLALLRGGRPASRQLGRLLSELAATRSSLRRESHQEATLKRPG